MREKLREIVPSFCDVRRKENLEAAPGTPSPASQRSAITQESLTRAPVLGLLRTGTVYGSELFPPGSDIWVLNPDGLEGKFLVAQDESRGHDQRMGSYLGFAGLGVQLLPGSLEGIS